MCKMLVIFVWVYQCIYKTSIVHVGLVLLSELSALQSDFVCMDDRKHCWGICCYLIFIDHVLCCAREWRKWAEALAVQLRPIYKLNGLVQERHDSGALAMELRLSCTNPSLPENDWNWWFPTIIWKSIHSIQFILAVYTSLVSVQNWLAFQPHWPNFRPSSGHKMNENGGFWPISEKVPLCGIMLTQSISNMVFTLFKVVFTNRPHSPNLAPLVTIW